MRLIACENIKPNMTLARNIYKQGCIYLREGERDLVKYAERLMDLGVDYVYVVDEHSEGIEIPDTVSEKTRAQCQDALRETFKRIESNSAVDMTVLAQPVSLMVNEIIYNRDVQINLTDISMMDEYTLGHSVSVAIYATLIGIEMGYDRKTLEDLAIGALLHDIGKVKLDARILFKEGALTEAEFRHIQNHSQFGYDILKFNKNLSKASRMISLCHHERLDGSGYPRGLRGDDINTFAKIVAVADVYDALSTNRCYREKSPINKIVDYLTEDSGTKFDAEILAIFFNKLAIYPNGSEVRLSDGTYGLVAKQSPIPFRPLIKVIKDANGRLINPYFVDLMKELNMVITASQLELEYSEVGKSSEV